MEACVPTRKAWTGDTVPVFVLTWKVWTDDTVPVFEGTEDKARAYLTARLAGRPEAVLESPDGESFGYQDGAWVCLDRRWDQ
jgi:hypothetical protein